MEYRYLLSGENGQEKGMFHVRCSFNEFELTRFRIELKGVNSPFVAGSKRRDEYQWFLGRCLLCCIAENNSSNNRKQ